LSEEIVYTSYNLPLMDVNIKVALNLGLIINLCKNKLTIKSK